MNDSDTSTTAPGFICRYAADHPVLEQRLNEHERRIGSMERDLRQDSKELWQALGRLEKTVENMKGYIAGAMVAAVMLGAIVSFIAAKVLSRAS